MSIVPKHYDSNLRGGVVTVALHVVRKISNFREKKLMFAYNFFNIMVVSVKAESKFYGTGHILIAVEHMIITVLDLSTKQSSFLLLVCFIDLEIRTRRR